MKRIIPIIILSFLLNYADVHAQCPSGTVSLQTQTAMDNFAANYPDCTEINGTLYIGGTVDNIVGLSNITKVNGELLFTGNSVLFDLAGFPQLDSIGGNLTISTNSSLRDISGLNGLAWLGGQAVIINNASLENISGLNQIAEMGSLDISDNVALESIKGFQQVKTLGTLEIINNINLSGLNGLEGLEQVNGNFSLENNDGLTGINQNNLMQVSGRLSISLNDNLMNVNGLQKLSDANELFFSANNALTAMTGLGELSAIAENLSILGNPVLTDISAFDHSINIGGEVLIISNSALSQCSVDAVCAHLVATGTITLQSNSSGCNNIAEIESDCPLPPCPMGNVVLTSQADVDDFVTNYPNCTEVDGNLMMGVVSSTSSDINDISGLSNLTSITGDLSIYSNFNLTSLIGLQKLDSIGGGLYIDGNINLVNLDALNQLSGVGGDISVGSNAALTGIGGLSQITAISGSLVIEANGVLNNLNGFGAITAIGGNLTLMDNPALKDISALDHALSINGGLTIQGNSQLAICDVQAICEHLELNGTTVITNNATNCNSIEQVTTICTVPVSNAVGESDISIFPNPSNGIFNVSGMTENTEITVYNSTGKVVYRTNNQINSINISTHPRGMYWLKIDNKSISAYKKMLLQ